MPSEPSATVTPASISSGTGQRPRIDMIALGLWTIFVPVRTQASMSPGARSIECDMNAFVPRRPILRECETLSPREVTVLLRLIAKYRLVSQVLRVVLRQEHGQRHTDVDTAGGAAMLRANDLLAGLPHLLERDFAILVTISAP